MNTQVLKSSFSVLALCCIASISSAFAPSTALAADPIEITSSKFPGQTFTLDVVTDFQGDLTGFSYADENGSPAMMSMSDLLGGISLIHMYGMDIIRLWVERGFDTQHGGHVVMQYVRNAFALRHRHGWLNIAFVREGARWAAYQADANGRPTSKTPFTHMDFVPGTAGISYIKTW